MLTVKGLSVTLGGKPILQNIHFDVQPGQWLMLVGPNGAGKSTLLHALSQGVPYRGAIAFEGQEVARMKAAQRARLMGLLSQRHEVGYAFTVQEVIRLGRYAQRSHWQGSGEADQLAVLEAARATGLTELMDHSVLTLSGGELQRVFLAQIFAQQPRLLLLDEPANHLDLQYQAQVFEMIQDWLQQPSHAVISVVHDLSLARRYATRGLLLNRGQQVAFGDPGEVLSASHLQAVWGMDVAGWMRDLLSEWT
jgi:iron complex transport system ATP-binding protein